MTTTTPLPWDLVCEVLVKNTEINDGKLEVEVECVSGQHDGKELHAVFGLPDEVSADDDEQAERAIRQPWEQVQIDRLERATGVQVADHYLMAGKRFRAQLTRPRGSNVYVMVPMTK